MDLVLGTVSSIGWEAGRAHRGATKEDTEVLVEMGEESANLGQSFCLSIVPR